MHCTPPCWVIEHANGVSGGRIFKKIWIYGTFSRVKWVFRRTKWLKNRGKLLVTLCGRLPPPRRISGWIFLGATDDGRQQQWLGGRGLSYMKSGVTQNRERVENTPKNPFCGQILHKFCKKRWKLVLKSVDVTYIKAQNLARSLERPNAQRVGVLGRSVGVAGGWGC